MLEEAGVMYQYAGEPFWTTRPTGGEVLPAIVASIASMTDTT